MPADRPTVSGWGLTPAPGIERRSEDLATATLGAHLTRGLGRSYGDASLPAPGDTVVVGSAAADRILEFDDESGVLRAEAGLSLGAIQRAFLPRGWTFPVLPGTQFVTLGGAVAADIHGKNHHRDGSLGRHVVELLIRKGDDTLARCGPEENSDLFRATVGGMGLTGHLLEVAVRLQPVPSPWIWQESRRIQGLEEFLLALGEEAGRWPYTVGWFDVLARGRNLGRGILINGRWAGPEEAPSEPPGPLKRFAVPFTPPGFLLNRWTVRIFNECYFRMHPRRPRRGIVHPEKFFHPLDAVLHWNRLYGPRGFTQHQCVLPERERPGATRRFLETLHERGAASFLCVIKDFGEEGEGLLSFPRPGITVTVDLPVRPDIQETIDALNRAVLEEGGRVYLAKDAFTRPEDFTAMDPRVPAFLDALSRWDPAGRLRSAQSVRLFGDRR